MEQNAYGILRGLCLGLPGNLRPALLYNVRQCGRLRQVVRGGKLRAVGAAVVRSDTDANPRADGTADTAAVAASDQRTHPTTMHRRIIMLPTAFRQTISHGAL